ncbi:MAG: hypothetical protein ACXVCP_19795 [Bdellovibrio sp.]
MDIKLIISLICFTGNIATASENITFLEAQARIDELLHTGRPIQRTIFRGVEPVYRNLCSVAISPNSSGDDFEISIRQSSPMSPYESVIFTSVDAFSASSKSSPQELLLQAFPENSDDDQNNGFYQELELKVISKTITTETVLVQINSSQGSQQGLQCQIEVKNGN